MAKKKVEEKINLDSILFKCRDILRQARNSGSFFEKRDMMLTLVFLRFIGEKFEDGIQDVDKRQVQNRPCGTASLLTNYKLNHLCNAEFTAVTHKGDAQKSITKKL